METTAFRVIDRGADLDVLGATHLVECTTLAIGCEGVEFGVPGARLALVQVYTPDTCFVFDIVDLQPEEAPTPALELLKSLLESSSIVKVAHDSKWHGLLLKQRCGILLSTVHDTASWHAVLRGMGDTLHATGLNETLHAYGCTTVPPRDTAGYTANPSFWETRPLTSQMKLRALQVHAADDGAPRDERKSGAGCSCAPHARAPLPPTARSRSTVSYTHLTLPTTPYV